MPERQKTIELGIRGLHGALGDHIAYFWETEDEFVEAIGFLERGFQEREHLVLFGHEDANARVLEVLKSKGHDTRSLQKHNRLSVLGSESSGELILSRIGATFQKAIDRGAKLIRLLGNIGWGRPDWPHEQEILRFEAKVTSAAARFPCIVICMYDIKSLSSSVVLHGAFGTHPLTIYGNLIRENPICVPVDEYLARLDAREKPTDRG